jgi:hypothetical protein
VIEFRDKEELNAWVAFAAGSLSGRWGAIEGVSASPAEVALDADELLERFRERRGRIAGVPPIRPPADPPKRQP